MLIHVVALLFSNCDLYYFKVNCTVGQVNTKVRERLQQYLAVQGETKFIFMLFAERELVMIISGAGNAP